MVNVGILPMKGMLRESLDREKARRRRAYFSSLMRRLRNR
jgi:hypothetical protein